MFIKPKVLFVCQNTKCKITKMVAQHVLKSRKYCSSKCACEFQKENGIRKGRDFNSQENLQKLYGQKEGLRRFILRLETHKVVGLKRRGLPSPMKGIPCPPERKIQISKTRKALILKKKLEKDQLDVDSKTLTKINYDSIYGEGKWDHLRKKMKGVFSLPWFIQKHGKAKGTNLYKQRCKRIKETTFFKVYNKTNKNNVSKISQELFWELYNKLELKNKKVYFNTLNHEYGCGTSRNRDFVLLDNKKVIEFNGDKFHANPKFYKINDKPNPFIKNLTAGQIWADDKEKIEELKNRGFSTLVIWETDYKTNKEAVIEHCTRFLTN